MARILLVEDNDDLAAGIRHNLELEGYAVDWIGEGSAALQEAIENPPDLIILDIMLPGLDGFEILRRLRAASIRTPVLILTARAGEADKVRGFRLDADQYLTKPFGLLELLERVRALLRKTESHHTRDSDATAHYRFGAIEVDVAAGRVQKNEADVSLTPRAFDLLIALIREEGCVMSRHQLLREVWGHRGTVVTRTVDSHISELRQKLEDDPRDPKHILTVWKRGYRFQR